MAASFGGAMFKSWIKAVHGRSSSRPRDRKGCGANQFLRDPGFKIHTGGGQEESDSYILCWNAKGIGGRQSSRARACSGSLGAAKPELCDGIGRRAGIQSKKTHQNGGVFEQFGTDVSFGRRRRQDSGDAEEGKASWKRKGYCFRTRFRREQEQRQEISSTGKKEGKPGGFFKWLGQSVGADPEEFGTPRARGKHQHLSVTGVVDGHTGQEEIEKHLGSRRGRREEQWRLIQRQWRKKKPATWGRQSSEGLSGRSQTNEKKSSSSCAPLHQGDREWNGSFSGSGIQPVGLQQEVAVGQEPHPFQGPLCGVGNPPSTTSRKRRTGSAAIGPTLESSLSGQSRQWVMEGGGSLDVPSRPAGAAPIWGRARAVGAHRQLLESNSGTGETECRIGRTTRRRRRKRKEKRKGKEIGELGRSCVDSPVVSCEQGSEESSLLKVIRSCHGSFCRFARIYARSCNETGECTLNPVENNSLTLFPSKLPWVKPPKKFGVRRGRTNKHRWEALRRMHLIWGLFNFLEGGSPCSRRATDDVVGRASSGVWTSCHESYARTMFCKVLKYVSHPEGTLERGTAKLDDLIKRIRLSFYDSSVSLDEVLSGAMPVNPDRISLPSEGGILDPLEHLVGSQLEQFRNMHVDIPNRGLIGKQIKPCHKVEPRQWPLLLKKLHDAKMITFLPIEEVEHECGKPLTGGLFCVPHKPTSDRLINDRRPLNAKEKRLDWSRLPAGHMLCQLILEKDESIRCSGDDLSNYFYLIKHSPNWLPRNCFGEPIWGKEMPGLNLNPNKKYLPSFCVVCMGDTNGVDIAQATHESVLRSAGCLEPKNTLTYGRVVPASDTLEGLYIDDHLVFQITKNKKKRDRGELLDEKLIRASRKRYAELQLPRSEKKAFEKEYDFKAWGTQVTSESGRVGTPYPKMKQIEALTIALLQEGRASKKALQKLLGLFVHPFMHRRELMATFHHIYVYIENMPEHDICRMPEFVKDELITAMLLLPLAETNVRSPVSNRISATDASSRKGGRASTITSKALAKTLYRFGEQKGEHTRLDWEMHHLEPPSAMELAPTPLVDAMQKHCWTSTQSMGFKKKEHINILEMEMVKQEIKARCNSNRGGCRVVNLCDSRVVVGAFAKGRSSSRNLNHKLRSCIPWLLVSDLRFTNLWVPTNKNPADFPSRNKPIPWPESSQSDGLLSDQDILAVQTFRSIGVQELLETEAKNSKVDPLYRDTPPVHENVSSQSCRLSTPDTKPAQKVSTDPPAETASSHAASRHWRFREIFAGKGRLTERLRRRSKLDIDEPVEYLKNGKIVASHDILNTSTFKRLKLEAAQPKQVWHFGMPCGSFSILQHSNGGTRRKSCPEGNGSLLREVIGNEILRRTNILISILEEHGSFWTLENPASSYLWSMKSMRERINNPRNHWVYFDQCFYGLQLKDDQGCLGPCKKPTKMLGNLTNLPKLEARCRCEKPHVHAVGGVRTKQGWKRRSELAGHYPLKLCHAYANIVSAM